MNRHKSELSEEQWEKIAPFLPEPQASPWGGPKPIPNRSCFEGILWVLRSGARWKDLENFPKDLLGSGQNGFAGISTPKYA